MHIEHGLKRNVIKFEFRVDIMFVCVVFFRSLTYKKLGCVENLKWGSKIPVFLFISCEINARTLEQLCCYDPVNLAFGVLILPKKSDCLAVRRTV